MSAACPYCHRPLRADRPRSCPHCGYHWSTCPRCGSAGQPQLFPTNDDHQCSADGGHQLAMTKGAP